MTVEIGGGAAELVREGQPPSISSTMTVPLIEPQSGVRMSHSFRVNAHAAAYSELTLLLRLYISKPGHTDLRPEPELSSMQLVETRQVNIQVTPGYVSSNQNDILLVTNSATRKRDIDAIASLFESSLGLKTNTWNLSTYGGLLAQAPGCPDEVESVMGDFEGKAIILLGNPFQTESQGEVTATMFCDPLSLLVASRRHTSCLFFGSTNSDKVKPVFDALFRPIECQAIQLANSLPETSKHRTFESVTKSLLESSSDSDQTHLVEVPKTRFKSKDKNMTRAAEQIASMLLSQVPQYHFHICRIPKQEADGGVDGHLLVRRGMRRTARIQAIQADLLRDGSSSSVTELKDEGLGRRNTRLRRTQATLSPYDKFALVGALPVATRLSILEQSNRPVPPELIELIELSIERQIDSEVHDFTELAVQINIKGEPRAKFFRECLPMIAELVDHVLRIEQCSSQTRRIVAHCFASCRPQTTSGAVSQAFNPLSHPRRLVEKFLMQTLGPRKKFGLEDSSLPSQRRVSSALEERVNEATGQASYFQRLASYGPSQSLRNNDILTVEQWDSVARKTKEMENTVLSLFDRFHEERDAWRFEQSAQSVNVSVI